MSTASADPPTQSERPDHVRAQGEIVLLDPPEPPPTPSDGKPSTHRSCHLSNQATAMAAAYLETGFLSDLQRAIRLAEEANAATPTDHPHCARHLALLAGFWVEFRRRMRAGASVGAEEKIDTAKLVSCGDGESAVV